MRILDRLVLSDAAWERMAPLIIGGFVQKGLTGRENCMCPSSNHLRPIGWLCNGVNRPGFVTGSNFQIGWSSYEQDDEQVFP
jgi:hypothetical protein